MSTNDKLWLALRKEAKDARASAARALLLQPLFIYHATVVRVVDGDTLDLDIDLGLRAWLKAQRIRLAGIDAPELGLRGGPGETSRKVLGGLLAVSRNQVVLQTFKARKDQYGRWLGVVHAMDGRGRQFNINTWMVQHKFAKARPIKEGL